MRRHSVGVPYWKEERGRKERKKRDGSPLLVLQSKTWNKGVFSSVKERAHIRALVKVSAIFTCAKCESAILAPWRSQLSPRPQPLFFFKKNIAR